MSPTVITRLRQLSERLKCNIHLLRNHHIRKIKVVCRLLQTKNLYDMRLEDRRVAHFLHHVLTANGPGMVILLTVIYGKRLMSRWTDGFYHCIANLLYENHHDLLCNTFGDIAPRIWEYGCSNGPVISIYDILRNPEDHPAMMDLSSNTNTEPNTTTRPTTNAQPLTSSLQPIRTGQTAISRTVEHTSEAHSYLKKTKEQWQATEIDESGHPYPVTQTTMHSGEASHVVHYNQTTVMEPQEDTFLATTNTNTLVENAATYLQPYPGTVPQSLIIANHNLFYPIASDQNQSHHNPPHILHPQPRRSSSQSQSDALMIQVRYVSSSPSASHLPILITSHQITQTTFH